MKQIVWRNFEINHLYYFLLLDLDQTEAKVEAKLSSASTVLGVQKSGLVIEEVFAPNKPEQIWVKGPIDINGYFTLKNPLTKKLLTGGSDSALIVKPGVHFDNNTKKFDFSAAVPQGVKVSLTILYIYRESSIKTVSVRTDF